MAIDPRVDIGHVHLKVADLDRSLAFYCGVLGFELQQRYGTQAAFVSAGGYHHHLGLNTWESAGGSPPPRNSTGLYHAAIRYPDRRTLADALRRVLDAGIPLDGASDHGVSEALYLRDPDGNGLELYRDRRARGMAALGRRRAARWSANGSTSPGSCASSTATAIGSTDGDAGSVGREDATRASAAATSSVLEADDPASDN